MHRARWIAAITLSLLCVGCQRVGKPSTQEPDRATSEVAYLSEWDATIPRGRFLVDRLSPRNTPWEQSRGESEPGSEGARAGDLTWHRGPLRLQEGRWWIEVSALDGDAWRVYHLPPEGPVRRLADREGHGGFWVDADQPDGIALGWSGRGERPEPSFVLALARADVAQRDPSTERLVRPSAGPTPVSETGETSPTVPVASALSDRGLYGGLRLRRSGTSAVLEGRAGGTRDASTLGQSCVGWIGRVPDHELVVEVPVHVRLHATPEVHDDLTLVLVGPGGRLHCRDDDEGLDPVFEGRLDVGTWAVHIGTWRPESDAAYRLDVRSAAE